MRLQTYYFLIVLLFTQSFIIFLLVFSHQEKICRLTQESRYIHSEKSPTDYLSRSKQQTRNPHRSRLRYASDIEVLLENKDACGSPAELDILFLVHSAVNYSQQRATLRTIFHEQSGYTNTTFRIVFVMGWSPISSYQTQIKDEFHTFGDVIQGNFKDTYRNLTHKAVLGIQWVSQNCRNAKYIIKLDDDVFVDMHNFDKYIQHRSTELKTKILCSWIKNSWIQRYNKWGVSMYKFRHYTSYPYLYCSGFAVVIPGRMVPILYKAVKSVPLFWVDDLFIYGIARSLISKLGVDYPGSRGLFHDSHRFIVECMNTTKNCGTVFGLVRKSQLMEIWKLRRQCLDRSRNSNTTST